MVLLNDFVDDAYCVADPTSMRKILSAKQILSLPLLVKELDVLYD
jgi:hypothetical protein